MLRKNKHYPQDKIIAQATLETPLGPVHLAFSAAGLAALALPGDNLCPIGTPAASPPPDSPQQETLKAWRHQVIKALEDYFAGRPVNFEDLPIDLEGSPFHLKVWQELRKIPPGETISYQEMARRLGNPKAARAVGQACGANPIPLIVPCHRVIAANGAMGGFSSGLERKRWLLTHEKATAGDG